ncbi:MAG: hypothetical protein JXX14_12905 [Deltaproteobacteria bacterium]|nr:hypothetical protein [Deltaproteobacteria bacterium]
MKATKQIGKVLQFGVLLLGLCASTVCAAQNGRLVGTEKLGDTRMLAMGGALRASNSNTSAVYLNPAAMGMSHVYHLNVKYQYTGLDNLHNGGIALVDSITHQVLSAGLSLDYLRSNKEATDFESWDGRLAGGLNIREVFFLGITGRYLRASQNVSGSARGPEGMALSAFPRNDTVQANGFTMDLGMAARAGDIVSLGLVAYNITNTGTLYAPFQLAGGISALIKNMWLLETDLVADFGSYSNTAMELQLGTELILKEQFSIRGGFDREFHFKVNSYSLGFGYSTTRFAIDLGYRQDIEYLERFRIALGFRIFIG